MLMQIADTFEKINFKFLSLHKEPRHFSLVNSSFKPKSKFIRTDCLGICKFHLETVQPVTGIGFHKPKR